MTPDEIGGRTGTEPADAPADPDARIAALETELAALRDRHLRLLADQENARRRTQRERDEAARFAASGIARDLLGTLDNLARALDAARAAADDPAVANLVSGVESTERGLLDALARHGIRRIDALGEAFDPNRHDALFEVPDTGESAGTVVTVVQPGYVHHDRLLRPARVGVATAAGAAPDATV